MTARIKKEKMILSLDPVRGAVNMERVGSGSPSAVFRKANVLQILSEKACWPVGVILSDYATLMVEILKDNARPEAGPLYGAIDMAWAKLVGQMAQVHGK